MSVSREESEAMGRVLAAMNNAINGSATAHSGSASAAFENSKKADSALNNIMENFRAATENLLETGVENHDFKMDIETDTTSNGVRIGSWEIAVREESGFGKYYDIAHTMTKEPIAADLRLYEAAHAIVRCLNEGETFTSARVKHILDLEQDYARALSDAVSFSSRMKITEGAQYDIAEARYGEAKRKAMTAKKSIEKLSK